VSFEDDPGNPWGGPSEKSISVKTVDLLLRLVDAGRGLASLMSPKDPRRGARVENLWKFHRKAESMILFELGRRRRVAKQLEAEAEELLEPLEEEEEEEEEDEGLDGFTF
jgi:hypothetical protein